MKQKELEFYMSVAESAAKMSHAVRLKVGCCLVTANGAMVYGYNGTPAGADNCCEYETESGLATKAEVAHAEWNALAKAGKEGLSTNDSVVFLTHSPCITCATLLSSFGVKRVIYKQMYRDSTGVDELKKSGVVVEKYENVFGEGFGYWHAVGDVTSLSGMHLKYHEHQICSGRTCTTIHSPFGLRED